MIKAKLFGEPPGPVWKAMCNLSLLGKLDLSVLCHSSFLKAKILPNRLFEGSCKESVIPGDAGEGGAAGQSRLTRGSVELQFHIHLPAGTQESHWNL